MADPVFADLLGQAASNCRLLVAAYDVLSFWAERSRRAAVHRGRWPTCSWVGQSPALLGPARLGAGIIVFTLASRSPGEIDRCRIPLACAVWTACTCPRVGRLP